MIRLIYWSVNHSCAIIILTMWVRFNVLLILIENNCFKHWRQEHFLVWFELILILFIVSQKVFGLDTSQRLTQGNFENPRPLPFWKSLIQWLILKGQVELSLWTNWCQGKILNNCLLNWKTANETHARSNSHSRFLFNLMV